MLAVAVTVGVVTIVIDDRMQCVAREKIGSGASARLILIIDVTERSPVGIADDET